MKESFDFNIRSAKEEDVPAILDVTPRAWEGFTLWERIEEKCGKIEGVTWADQKVGDVRDICRYLDSIIVAEARGRLIGYASYFVVDKIFKIGEIGNNAVDPEYQGRGVGTALIKKIVEIFKQKDVKLIRVVALKDNPAARRVYEKCGFKEIVHSVHYAQIVPK